MKKNIAITLLVLVVAYMFLSNLGWLIFALKRVLLLGGVLGIVAWIFWPEKKEVKA
jgi:hypothetical protein